MASELIQICNYLHDILTFRNYIEIPENRDFYFTISDEELETGRLDKNNDGIKPLLESWRNKEKGENKNSLVDIILIPKVVSDIVPKYTSPRAKKKDQIWEYKIVSLLYIKATIDMETLQIKSKTGETIIWADPLIKKSESLFTKLLKSHYSQSYLIEF